MACGSCGRSNGAARTASNVINNKTRYGAPRQTARSITAQEEGPMVQAIYRGPHGNHYIPSPTKKVHYYGYGVHGTKVEIYPEDAAARPDLFEVIPVISEAPKEPGKPKPVESPSEEEKAEGAGEAIDLYDLTLVDNVGPARAKRLMDIGIETIEELAQESKESLAEKLSISDAAAEAIVASAQKLMG